MIVTDIVVVSGDEAMAKFAEQPIKEARGHYEQCCDENLQPVGWRLCLRPIVP